MSHLPRCPKCGVPLAADAPAGLCPKCLVQAGLESDPALPSGPQPTATSPAGSGFVPPSVAELAGRIPHVEILELVGQGGMGAVYKARQPGLDRLVAVKILPSEVGRDASFAERFTREARALARLSHPHIVAVHDFGQAGGLFYFVMEFIDGTNLRQAMQAGELAPAQALAIVPQICDALQYAHDEGVVHRDIKPENILLDKRGRVKIADFGLSKLVAGGGRMPERSLTGTHQMMGTVRYMAPEQLEGAKAVDHRADIYSLGVVFYEMLTGELPLGRFAPPSQKVEVDVRLDEVVLRTLEKEPQRRYQQAGEVKTAVQTIAGVKPSAPLIESKSPGLREGEAPAEPSLPPGSRFVAALPWRFWNWATAMWLVGWLLTAALWNFRLSGLALATVIMTAIGYGVMRWCVSLLPAIESEQRRMGLGLKTFNCATALLMFVLGFWALIAAHTPFWENAWLGGTSSHRGVALGDRYQGKEHHLLRELSAFREEIPRVELVMQGAHFEMSFHGSLWMAITGFTLVGGGAAALLDAPLFRRHWARYFGLACAHATALVVALGAAHLGATFASMIQFERTADGWSLGSGLSVTGVGRQVTCQASSEQVAAAIREWMETSGYRPTYRSEWKLDTVPTGKTIAYVRVQGAKKRSMFDAIYMTWRGPRRVAPYLDVRWISSVSPVESSVTIDAGAARKGFGEEESYAPVLDGLEQAIKGAASRKAE
ncbi:MAG: serine/threonine protein kinase [Planctomycetaceae bacterium]|nr:serine/threonine protein kinase [Planctomycetaceae bacterium]